VRKNSETSYRNSYEPKLEKKTTEQMADNNEEMAAGDDHEVLCDASDEAATNEINKQLMKNPEVLAALQRQLGDLGPSPADYIRSLPKVVRRRLKALKKLQSEANKIESRFFEEVHQIECKYATEYEPLVQKRHDIVTAVVEPTDDDCDWPSDDEDLAEDLQTKAKIEDNAADAEDPKGIPDFWLTIFKNVDMLSEMVQENDEPILKHLKDIKLHINPSSGFTLEFMFEPNEYFTNTSLKKEYIYRFSVDEANPLSYEGPEIIKCNGCTIDWQKGKNVTVKVIKKVQKHKGRGTKRTVTKTVQADSFFNFFSPPTVLDDEEPEEETESILSADFEIGHFIREHIVPRAVLYFTGEALEEDDDEYDDGEGEDEDEDEEEEDDDDVDVKSHPMPKGPGKK
jgi:nucleosome assembly protein 1-like 1